MKITDSEDKQKVVEDEWDRDTKLLDDFIKNYPEFAPKWNIDGTPYKPKEKEKEQQNDSSSEQQQ